MVEESIHTKEQPRCATRGYLGYPPSASLLEELERIERERMYQRQVFFIEHLGFCQPSSARKITFEASLVFEHIHEATYLSLGHDLLKIAPAALAERVHHIMEWTRYILEKP